MTDIRVFEWGNRAQVRVGERQRRARSHLNPMESAPAKQASAHTSARAQEGHPLRFGNLELIGNQTAAVRARRTFDVGGARVSPTANLISISRPSTNGGRCVALLGVGHTHRGTGKMERHWLKVSASRPPRLHISAASRSVSAAPQLRLPHCCEVGRGRSADYSAGTSTTTGMRSESRYSPRRSSAQQVRRPFAFGYQYTHFWYTMQPRPPHRLLATSGEFCIGAEQDGDDCESVQFVAGLAHHPPGSEERAPLSRAIDVGDPLFTCLWPCEQETMLLSYGINDCEAKVARMPAARVWEMLRTLEGEEGPCELQ